MPDLPGSGGSPLHQYVSLAEMADQVAGILDHEGIDRAIVAGHSMGGYVAFEMAARHASRLAGLSLIHSLPTSDDDARKAIRRKSIDLIKNGGRGQFLTQAIPNLFAPTTLQQHPGIVDEELQLALAIPDESLINYYEAMIARADHTNTLRNVSFPVHWTIGREDNIMNYKKILEFCYLSGINFVTFLVECGHMSMLEAPVRLTGSLLDFCAYCNEVK